MFEREIRDLAFVPRWAIIRVNRQQNVAEHSFFVAVYADRIATLLGWEGPRDVLMRYALYHDMDEILTGDISAPSKKVMEAASGVGWHIVEKWMDQRMEDRISKYMESVGVPEEWKEQIYAIVGIADLYEAILFLADEEFSGNKNGVTCRKDCEDRLWQAVSKLESKWFTPVYNLTMALKSGIGEALGMCSALVTNRDPIR